MEYYPEYYFPKEREMTIFEKAIAEVENNHTNSTELSPREILEKNLTWKIF